MLDLDSEDALAWKAFLDNFKKRHTVIYDLDESNTHQKLYSYFDVYNNNTYDAKTNEELFSEFLLKNKLIYSNYKCYKQVDNTKNFNYDNLLVRNIEIAEPIKDYPKYDFADYKLEEIKVYDFISSDVIKNLNNNINIEVTKDFISAIHDNIQSLPKSRFKNLLFNESYNLVDLYDNYLFSDYTDINYIQSSFNRLNYLYIFYTQLLEFDKLNITSKDLYEAVSNSCNIQFDYFSLDKFKFILKLTNQDESL